MRIVCQNCSAVYEVDGIAIPPQGIKMRCSKCGEVFICRHDEPETHYESPEKEKIASTFEDVHPSAETEENTSPVLPEESKVPITEVEKTTDTEKTNKDEVKDIFQRLSLQTEELFREEQQMPKAKAAGIKLKHLLGLQNKKFRRFLYVLSVVILLLLLYYFRYSITRKLPFLENVYALVGIEAAIPGEGLEFQNVTRREFEEDYVNKIEIKGFITNTTKHQIKVPEIKLETLDREARLLHEQYEKPAVALLDGSGRIAFSIIISKPSPLSKYVYLTFVKKRPD